MRPRALAGIRTLPRSEDFGELQETFLAAAVATILVIRTQLWLTNYPQLGGAGLHIAHLLWGGVFMVIAIGLLVTFLGRGVRRPAAVVGGVGFGFFIDELGKFITADNNYFFRPAAALIYVIFIGLFLLSRVQQRRSGLTPGEALLNAIDRLGEAARHRFDENDRRRALELLDEADPADPLVRAVRRLVDDLEALPPSPAPRSARLAAGARERYLELAGRDGFPVLLGWVFLGWALLSISGVAELVLSVGGLELGNALPGFESDALGDLSLVNVASLVSAAVSTAFVVVGLGRFRRGDRLEAYRAFDRALLIAILVTQVFAFVESQFAAVLGLAVDLALLATTRYMIAQERRAARAAPLAPAAV